MLLKQPLIYGSDIIFPYLIFQIYSPDLIICDILMPKIGGLELLAKLGMHPEHKIIPLIFFIARKVKKRISKQLWMPVPTTM